jgi:predicted phosphodiesterase
MKIGVLSDTHDRLPESVVRTLAGAEEIWHLGDVCLPGTLAGLKQIGVPLRVEGMRVRLIHIPPKRPPEGFVLLLHGHTHVPRNEMLSQTRFLNPGCVTRPNRGAPASFAWLDLTEGEPPRWTLVGC